MKKSNAKGFSTFELLAASVILVLIISVGCLVYARHNTQSTSNLIGESSVKEAPLPKPTGKQLGTYKVSDDLYPKLPSTYELIHTDKGTQVNGATGVDYITNVSLSTFESDIKAICASYGFSLEEFSDSTGSNNDGPTFTSTDGQCNDDDNTWGFSITSADDIQYQDWKSSLPASVLKQDLAHMSWVSVGSFGPPITSGGAASSQ